MSERPFIKLANQARSKNASTKLARHEIKVSLDRLIAGEKPGTFALRNLEALSDPFRFKTPYQLERELTISKISTEAAKDFLHFYQTGNHSRLHRCPWCMQYFIGRPNKKYCSPDCKDNYHNRRHSVSGYAREAMRKHRASK